MVFGRKRKNEVPPVAPAYPAFAPYQASSGSSYGAPPARMGYSFRSTSPCPPTVLPSPELDSTAVSRRELLGGARPPQRSSASRFPELDDPEVQGMSEDDVMKLANDRILGLKEDSVMSSRNALQTAQQALETAKSTALRLGDQSERLARTEAELDLAKVHAARAEDDTREVIAANRSIFMPAITMNKQAKRDAEERRLLARHQEASAAREDIRRTQLESRDRIGAAVRGVPSVAERASAAARAKLVGNRYASAPSTARKIDREKYRIQQSEWDDALEDELEGNLDGIHGLAGQLKLLSTAMGNEIDAQLGQIDSIGKKADTLDVDLVRQTRQLERIK